MISHVVARARAHLQRLLDLWFIKVTNARYRTSEIKWIGLALETRLVLRMQTPCRRLAIITLGANATVINAPPAASHKGGGGGMVSLT